VYCCRFKTVGTVASVNTEHKTMPPLLEVYCKQWVTQNAEILLKILCHGYLRTKYFDCGKCAQVSRHDKKFRCHTDIIWAYWPYKMITATTVGRITSWLPRVYYCQFYSASRCLSARFIAQRDTVLSFLAAFGLICRLVASSYCAIFDISMSVAIVLNF